MAEVTLETLSAQLSALASDVSSMRSGFGALASDVSTLRSSFGALASEVSTLRSGFGALTSEVSTLRSGFGALTSEVSTLRSGFGALAAEVSTLRSDFQARFSTLEARVIGLPIVGEAITVLQRDVRMLTAAVNDMARINMTAGEAERLHTELERIAAKQMELEARILLIEQRSQS